MMTMILADVTGGMDPAMVGTMIGGMLATMLGGGFLGKKISDTARVKIDGQPLAVKMEDHFVTRREFERLESSVNAHVVELKGIIGGNAAEMKALFRETMTAIGQRDKSLSDKIESVASSAYEGRRRLHDKTNNHGERLKSLEDRVPVKRA